MTRLHAIAVFLALTLLSLTAAAVTIQPLPGSAPQTAQPNAYFPQIVGVMVRGDDGLPIGNAEVVFSFEASAPEDPFLMFMDSGGSTTTNADGIATLVVAAGQQTGVVRMTVYSGEAASPVMLFTIEGERPVVMKLVSGDEQVAETMQSFPRPWVVRALDSRGHFVPRAVVIFNGQSDSGQPGALFDGQDMVAVMADGSGIATSPLPRANEILGPGIGDACGFDMACTNYRFTIVPSPATAASIRPLAGSTPQTTCNSCFFPNPIGVVVRDHQGQPMAGVPVTFSIPDVDSVSIFQFDLGRTTRLMTVDTNADGIAAPVFVAFGKDKATVTATTPIALGDAVFDLKVKERGVTYFEIVSGTNQSAPIFSTYAQPWTVRALDRHGSPVANAAVLFGVPDLPDYPGGRFGNRNVVVVATDAAGVATAPRVTANGVAGVNVGSAISFFGDASVQFYFVNFAP